LLAGLAVLPIFFSLGDHPIHGDSEARYGTIARAMAEGESPLLVPHLFDRPHLTKPPLTYWLMAGSIWLFGDGEWALRLPAALAGTLTLAITFGLGYRRFGWRRAWAATALLSVTPMFVVLSRLAITDSLLAVATTGALACGALAVMEDKARWRLGLWSCVAIGLLVKGPAAWLAPGALVAWVLWERAGWRKLGLGWGLVLSALPLAVWVAAVWAWHPDAWAIWRYEIWDRAVGRGDHPEPWWFFFPVFALGLLPGTALLLTRAGRRLIRSAFRRPDPEFIDPARLWVAMILLTFTVFTLIGGKLMSYLLPTAPALAWWMSQAIEKKDDKEHYEFGSTRLGWRLAWVGAAVLVLAVQWVEDRVYGVHSSRALASEIGEAIPIDRPEVWTVGFIDRSLIYYTRRPTRRIDPRIMPEAWAEAPLERLVLVADPVEWDRFASDPYWDLDAMYDPVPVELHLGWGGPPLEAYRPRLDFRFP
jgi:4-amino-4-deoxy-L-arabinose transferase-like glycosyltransferase